VTLHVEYPAIWLVFYPSGGIAMSYPPEHRDAALVLVKELRGFMVPLPLFIDCRGDQEGTHS
jgi:hypothetical protein